MRRLTLAVLAALAAAPARAAAPPAVARLADAVAQEVGAAPPGRRSLVLAVDARGALGPPLETALSASLAARGFAVAPRRGAGDAERAARDAGQDWLLRVRAGLVPGRREIAAVGELIPTWRSFFMQRRPEVRPGPPRVVGARVPADGGTLVLAREPRGPGEPFARIRMLARVRGRVLALAAGELDEQGREGVVAVTEEELVVIGPDGARIASRAADGALAPVRDPAASVAVGDFGGGRIALRRAGAAAGEVLALRGDRLEPAGALDAAPLCAGGAGRLFGGFVPGTGVLADVLAPLVDPTARPRSARTQYGVAAAPRAGPVAFAVLGTDLELELLGPTLAPVARAPAAPSPRPSPAAAAEGEGERSGSHLPSPAAATVGEGGRSASEGGGTRARAGEGILTGSGFALADLDGDGTAELVASSADPRAPERIRVIAPLALSPLLLESATIDGAVLAGAAADLTGDGVDDAVVAAVRSSDGAWTTDLLLVTSDAREAP